MSLASGVAGRPGIPGATEAFIDGRVVLPLLALWVAASCSTWFGLPDLAGLPHLTAERMIFVAVVGYALISVALRRRASGSVTLFEAGLWLFVVLAAASGVAFGGFASGYTGAGVSILFNFVLFPAVAYSIVVRTKYTERDLKAFLFILTLFGLYLGATAILERTAFAPWLLPPDISDKSIVQHWGRSRGPFLQAEFNGATMVQLVPVALLLSRARSLAIRLLGWATLPLLCVGTYFTETRAALLSLVLVLVLGSFGFAASPQAYRRILAAMAIVSVVLLTTGVAVIPRFDELSPVYDRLNLLLVTLGMIAAHPIAGIGFGNFDLYQEQFFLHPRVLGDLSVTTRAEFWAGGTHNTWLTPVAELGVLTGGLYIVLLLWGVSAAFLKTRAAARAGPLAPFEADRLLCCFLTGAAFFVNSTLVELRFTLTPNALYWIFIALSGAGPPVLTRAGSITSLRRDP